MQRLTKDALEIVVQVGKAQELHPGLIVYGLFTSRSAKPDNFPQRVWPQTPDPQSFRLTGTGWEVMLWEIPIIRWPAVDVFQAAIAVTLGAMIARGALVAWVGGEGFPFCDPPSLFDPVCMSGGVLAWMKNTGEVECDLDPERLIVPVPDRTLLRLRHFTAGLSDLPDV